MLNKAGDGWLPFAARYTGGSEALYNLSNIGSITTQSTIDVGGYALFRSNIFFMDKAGSGWIYWATRNTAGSEVVCDLTNIGTITSNAAPIFPLTGLIKGNGASALSAIASGTSSQYLRGDFTLQTLPLVSATSAVTASAYIATSSGGAVTTQLHKRDITLSDGSTITVYVP
jgi:hypothetical protein